MIVIGIPTYNEVDNITRLTEQIEQAADELGVLIEIVNADSNSTDGTRDAFMHTPTHSKKISIQNSKKGKGRNVRSILEYVVNSKDATGCLLIDGDVTSFNPSWLSGQVKMLSEGYDYTIPTYSRSYQEGNTTNHFAYPLLGMRFNGIAPRQPIAGDFGMSARFAKYMLGQQWHAYTYGYGIDIFLTLHALHGGHKVIEMPLGKKIHKPSFNKMTSMFRDVAASYYETVRVTSEGRDSQDTLLHRAASPDMLQGSSVSSSDIERRRLEAIKLYKNTRSLVPHLSIGPSTRVTTDVWIYVLFLHEQAAERNKSLSIAQSILPWYLMRVVTYLEDNSDAKKATDEIQNQFNTATTLWQQRARQSN